MSEPALGLLCALVVALIVAILVLDPSLSLRQRGVNVLSLFMTGVIVGWLLRAMVYG